MTDVEYWRNRYERQGRSYVARNGSRRSYAEQLAALTPYVAAWCPEGTVLDFGCGVRRFQPVIGGQGAAYVGYDLLPELSDFEMLPNEVDGAMAIFVLQHVVGEADHQSVVSRLYRCLRSGGSLLVVDHEVRDGMAGHMKPRGPAGILKCGGWSSCEILGHYDDHWIGVFAKACQESERAAGVGQVPRRL